MSKLEKRLVVFALVFVAIYIAAITHTIHSRVTRPEKNLIIESAEPLPGERHLMLAELFLPMMILLVIAISFVVVRKKREISERLLDDTEDEFL